MDVDFGQTGHLVGLDMCIAALQVVRDGLGDLYGGSDWVGRCLGSGNTGRRLESHGHDGEHKWPTEAEMCALARIGAGGLGAT